jgi:hypothetical protein
VNFPVIHGVSASTAASKNHLAAVHDLAVFEPCFLMQGVVLALAAWQFLGTPTARRSWLVSIMLGAVVIDVFGGMLSLAGACTLRLADRSSRSSSRGAPTLVHDHQASHDIETDPD